MHGQYTIDAYLNSGGFGITYRAKDSLGRPVVIKECFPGVMCLRKGTKVAARSSEYKEELAGMIEGFVREAHNLAALTHKHIVHVHQVFEENDTAYMAIDFIEGMDLLERIDLDSDRMSAKEIVRLTKRILPAVRYIHDKGMLHRDISPDNILIDASGEPMLIDFGAARKNAPSSRRAVSQMKFVKDGYSPQEFYIAGAEQGPWSDIYSLAASLYHAISGEAPEESQKRMSALAQKQPDPYVPLAKRIRGYPPQFLETIDAALKVNPQDRIQSAEEWMRRLSNRPPKAQTAGKQAEAAPVSAVKITAPKANKQVKLPDLREISVRKQMLSHEAQTQRRKSAGLIGGLAIVLAAGAGVGAYLVSGKVDPATTLVAETPAELVIPPVLPTIPAIPVAIPVEELVFPVEGVIASDTAAREANAARAAQAVIPEIPASAQIAPPSRPRNLIPEVTQPEIALPAVADADFVFRVEISDATGISVEKDSRPQIAGLANALVAVENEGSPAMETTPPAASIPVPATGPILVNQIIGSHWDVDMPFQSDLIRVRNSHTVEITEISETADLSISGSWIKPGTTIYAFNGDQLPANTDISVLILSTLDIDPDGYARATVRYKDIDTGIIDRGLLAVPTFRQMTFADGTVLAASVRDLQWQIVVTESGPRTNGLAVDDILLGERSTGIAFVTHNDLAAAMDRLANGGFESALFEVRRGAETLDVPVPLSRSLD